MSTTLAKGASPVTFRDYMESALYGEGGFYGTRIPRADFYTAPELHPVFGQSLADEVALRLDALERAGAPRPYSIVEMGSGSGLLAEQVITALRQRHPERLAGTRFVLVERERKLLVSSILRLSDLGPTVQGVRISGLSGVDELTPCSGVFFSNELVDALPFHLLERKGKKTQEVYVESDGTTRLGELSTAELAPYAAWLGDVEEGRRHAVSLDTLRWLGSASRRLLQGYLITVDYGSRLGRNALNPPRAFYRHTVDDRLTTPGRDLTANVDFETLIEEGRKLGLEVESFRTLGQFLLERMGTPQPVDDKALLKIKTLIHPDGMGEAYKVLVQRKT
ncbi:MAG: SAM-dependent methyltransferase [Elusimicrobia bacterium]|nr:SAM-dependent methyltransferase [Elusimicrobiota bacterium]